MAELVGVAIEPSPAGSEGESRTRRISFDDAVINAVSENAAKMKITDMMKRVPEGTDGRAALSSISAEKGGPVWKRLRSFLSVDTTGGSSRSNFRVRAPSSVGFVQRLKMLQDRTGGDGRPQVSRRSDAVAALMQQRKSVRPEDLTQQELLEQRHLDRVARGRFHDVPEHLKAKISKAELDILLDLFTASDSDKSGLIGVAELPDMLRILGLNPVEFTVKALLKEFDDSADGELNFGEFVSLWYSYREETSKEDVTLEMAFDFFDKDGSDTITKTEFATVLQELGEPLTTEEINEFFRLVDTDKSGKISKSEFMKACGPDGAASALQGASSKGQAEDS